MSQESRRLEAVVLLLSGAVLTIAGNTRWGVGALAWLAPIFFLATLRRTEGWRWRALVFLTLFAGWTLATTKIVTAPVPWMIALGYGLPIALLHFPAFLFWDALVKREREGLAVVAFAASTALAEWAQAELTPLGVWGAGPTSQVGQLALLQVLALVGMPGLSFAMHSVMALVERVAAGTLRPRALVFTGAAMAAVLTWGAWRSEQRIDGPMVRAAAIRTDSNFMGLPIESRETRQLVDEALFARTRDAARAGAQLISWTEAATLVLPEEEAAMISAASSSARENRVELVISYIMPISLEPLRYENRLRWFSPEGTERLSYLKHHPVPGEPAVPGEAPAPLLATTIGPASGAICYDLDFPLLARAHARSGAGIVVVPSSDWRGIDPVHTEMAAMRAIEGGYSVLRSTRWGLTGGIDARGRILSSMSTNGGAEPFLLVSLPVVPQPTLYASLGNAVLVPLAFFVLWGLFALLPARRGRPVGGPVLGV